MRFGSSHGEAVARALQSFAARSTQSRGGGAGGSGSASGGASRSEDLRFELRVGTISAAVLANYRQGPGSVHRRPDIPGRRRRGVGAASKARRLRDAAAWGDHDVRGKGQGGSLVNSDYRCGNGECHGFRASWSRPESRGDRTDVVLRVSRFPTRLNHAAGLASPTRVSGGFLRFQSTIILASRRSKLAARRSKDA
jgi:hypothetical protein